MFVKINNTFKTPYGEYPIYVKASDLAIVEKANNRKCELIGLTPEPGYLGSALELIGCTLRDDNISLDIQCIQLAFGYKIKSGG